jgi:zinc protease
MLIGVVVGIAIAWFCLGVTPALAKIPEHYTELEFPPLKEITIPEYERYELNNGMVVYLIEDHALPLIAGNAVIRVGSRLEQPQQVGVAELMGLSWRSGGTNKHDSTAINLLLEDKAATIESSIGVASGNLSFNALSTDIETILPLYAEIMRYPAFEEEQIIVAKNQISGGIARRNDNPGEIASREFNKLIYGGQSPYARTIEYQTLDPLARQDVIEFYQSYIHPEQVILGIVGDFDSKQMKQLIAKNFADWRKGKSPSITSPIPTAQQNQSGGIYLVNQPQLSQSNILLGHLGGEFTDPEYPILSVLNGLLNGFGGRLFQELRSRQGLAYSVYGVWSPRYDYSGLFIAGGQTRSQATVDLIKSLLAEIKRVRTAPISGAELEYAKNSILNSFVFEFEQPTQTLSRLMSYEYYGYPEDFMFKYQQGVQKTSRADILRVAQTHLKPEDIVILVVGNQEQINPPLTNLESDIQILDISPLPS